MAAHLLDSSAVVKRYVLETGSAWVTALVDPAAGHRTYLAGITGVEVVSAITRRQRGGGLSLADATLLLTAFRRHLSGPYVVVDLTPSHIARAMDIAEKHALRGYDAVQLAVAIGLNVIATVAGETFVLISADAALLAAATAEGLAVDDPNAHP
jgi:predicted nucleic acid-binding protein